MRLPFGHNRGSPSPQVTPPVPAVVVEVTDAPAQVMKAKAMRRRTGRTAVYAARVTEGFKDKLVALQAELILEQCRNGKARRITDGELLEILLETFKALRRDRDREQATNIVSDDVWEGLRAIAAHFGVKPEEALERIVVEKVDELRLLPVAAPA